MSEYQQYANNFPSLVAADADPDPNKCVCKGSGWVLSQLDSWYQCPCHKGMRHPEDDYDQDYSDEEVVELLLLKEIREDEALCKPEEISDYPEDSIPF